VIIETPKHPQQLQDLSVSHLAELFKVYADRMRAMKRDKKINYIIAFKNFGHDAGASIEHAHSQMIGTAFVPPHMEDKTVQEHRYQGLYGNCPYCDVLREEMRGPRKIYADADVVAFAPYAPMHAYEAWIMPRRHVDNVSQLNSAERTAFARALKCILSAVHRLGVPYNYYFHERVGDPDQHLYLKIAPRGALWGSMEIGTGLIINPVPPEDAARFYRNKI
jgi:UDPglucose--hexose-1-phosphate uridylyltransferase